jgi:uncharacterized membrane protein (UPF0127 family)
MAALANVMMMVRTSAMLACLLPVCAACGQQPSSPPATQPAPSQPAQKPEAQPAPKPDVKPETRPEAKPAVKPEAKPEAKPDAKPDSKPDAKPDSAPKDAQADAWPPPANPPLPTMDVKLGGKTFKLEKAMENQTRFGGLSGRREIAEDGGMIFVFKLPQPLNFVMRDCPISIDIIYVDATGRITAMHHMVPEPPRSAEEQPIPDERQPKWAWSNPKYESRLKQYPSRFAGVIAIELRANTLNINGSNPNGIKLNVGDKLDLDIAKLRQAAK